MNKQKQNKKGFHLNSSKLNRALFKMEDGEIMRISKSSWKGRKIGVTRWIHMVVYLKRSLLYGLKFWSMKTKNGWIVGRGLKDLVFRRKKTGGETK